MPKTALIKLPGTQVLRWPPHNTAKFRICDRGLDRSRDRCSDLILNSKHIFDLMIVALRPELISSLRIDKPSVYPYTPCGTSNTTFYDVTHAQFAGCVLQVNCISFIRKARVAGYHE
jgi:hypothetical protein